jgi:hypothetical protein
MSRPRFPIGCVLPVGAIQRIREEQASYDRDPEKYERDKEWSLDECCRRGCLPTGEPIDALYGPGDWS